MVILKAGHVGIQGDPDEICVPVGFKVFSAGASYFHEGISLQEALVPVIVVRIRTSLAGQGRRQIAVQYRSDRFTSRVIGLRVECSGLDFGEAVRVREEAKVGLFRLEITTTAGTGKLHTPTGLDRSVRESL